MIAKRKDCLYCGEEMESITAKKKFCSDKCKVYYSREKIRGTFSIPSKSIERTIKEVQQKREVKEVYFAPEKIKTFQDYLRDIQGLEMEEDCKDWVTVVGADENLTPLQKRGLIDRLKNKWI